MDTQQLPRPAACQKLPPAFSGILNAPEDHRDSAYFSGNDASSKHTSAASIAHLSSGYASVHDKTPSPTPVPPTIPQPLVSPSSNMSVASMVSPSSPASSDQKRLDTPSSATITVNSEPGSRRESVDSRMNQNFCDMRLGGSSSLYATHNHSATSIQGTLAQQRNPRPGFDTLAVHRISNGYQPSAERNPDPDSKIVRTAPAITGPTTGSIARAAEPVKGQAWAFPEDAAASGQVAYHHDSRRSSIADSLASSQYTGDSRLPPVSPGQRNLPDQEFTRLSATSVEFPPVHHHSLQPNSAIDGSNGDPSSQTGSQPYSRTPELRISHKLAERKRRTEMKELFELLKDLMPQERGSKASKWEILTKAIAEHQRQTEAIKQWQVHCGKQQADIENLRHELHALRVENEQLRTGVSTNGSGPTPQQRPALYNPEDAYPRQVRPELPPLRGAVNNGPPDPMAGVQYDTQRLQAPNEFQPGGRGSY